MQELEKAARRATIFLVLIKTNVSNKIYEIFPMKILNKRKLKELIETDCHLVSLSVTDHHTLSLTVTYCH